MRLSKSHSRKALLFLWGAAYNFQELLFECKALVKNQGKKGDRFRINSDGKTMGKR
jgi:hypothetical protein